MNTQMLTLEDSFEHLYDSMPCVRNASLEKKAERDWGEKKNIVCFGYYQTRLVRVRETVTIDTLPLLFVPNHKVKSKRRFFFTLSFT